MNIVRRQNENPVQWLLRLTSAVLSYLITLSHAPLSAPMKERYGRLLWSVLFPVLRGFGPLQRLALRTGNIQEELSQEGSRDRTALLDIPGCENEEVSVLFSGGADSTLAAYLLAQKFKRVHLLTCRHLGIRDPEKTEINYQNLKKVFGDKVVHRIIDVNDGLMKVFSAQYWSRFRRFGFLSQNMCGPCKLTMHAAAIAYNRQNGIRYVASGAHMEGAGVFVDQMLRARGEVLEPLFRQFGMELLNPVYYTKDTAGRLYELGITKIRETKFPNDNTFYQAWCNFSVLTNIFARGYFLQTHPQEQLVDLQVELAKARLPALLEYIEEKA